MNKKWPWIAIIFIGIIGLFVVFRVFAPEEDEREVVGEDESAFARGELRRDEETTGASGASPFDSLDSLRAGEATIGSEGLTLPEGWREIGGGDFVIDTPLAWVVTEEENYQPSVEKFSLRYFLASGQTNEAYGDPDVVTINISDLEKNGKTFDEVVNTFAKNEITAESLVELMRTNANPPYNELTKDDIKISQADVILNNGIVAKKNVFQCLKVCYLEGPPVTIVEYFIEAQNKIFKLSVSTPTSGKTDVLLLVAEQVVKTFGVR